MITYWSVTSSWSILLSLSRVSEDSRLWCVFIPTAHLPLTLTSVLLSSAVTVCVYPTFIFEHEVTGLSFHTQLFTLAANWRKELLTPLFASNLFLVCICEFRSWLQKLGALSCEWLLMFGGILWLLVALGGFKGPVMFVCVAESLLHDYVRTLLRICFNQMWNIIVLLLLLPVASPI